MRKFGYLLFILICLNSCKKSNTSSAVELRSVKIGTQTWQSANLDVSTYRNGDPIPEVTDSAQWRTLTTGAWCYYNNSPANGAVYGKLYNWYAVNDPRGLAPAGWHVATDNEWTILTDYLGGPIVAGGKLKADCICWYPPNDGAASSNLFAALPGLYRSITGQFYYTVGLSGSWWAASEANSIYAWSRMIFHDEIAIRRNEGSRPVGMSVRCIKN